mmetsp:Transcript_7276/g.24021  ORF Transcript_7276/g.24021 Transcript_7276/m.24021 type:complete len:216 (+) Transcript_7276:1658-2305(+)
MSATATSSRKACSPSSRSATASRTPRSSTGRSRRPRARSLSPTQPPRRSSPSRSRFATRAAATAARSCSCTSPPAAGVAASIGRRESCAPFARCGCLAASPRRCGWTSMRAPLHSTTRAPAAGASRAGSTSSWRAPPPRTCGRAPSCRCPPRARRHRTRAPSPPTRPTSRRQTRCWARWGCRCSRSGRCGPLTGGPPSARWATRRAAAGSASTRC